MRGFILFILLLSSSVIGQQSTLRGYDLASDIFWDALYPELGETIYCSEDFTGKTRGLQIEHVVPASVIAEHFGCDSRKCDVEEYLYAEADLHNLYPVVGRFNGSRGNIPFGLVPEKERDFGCDAFKRAYGDDARLEPHDEAKGDIARTLLYMESAYGVPIREDRAMLEEWIEMDPVTNEELWRSRLVDYIQGSVR